MEGGCGGGVPRPVAGKDHAGTGHGGRGDPRVAGAEATVWNGYFFPKGTPQPIVRKMNKALGDMLARPDFREKSEALGLSLVPPEQRSPEYFAKYLNEEIERWGKVIHAGGISVD